MLSRIAHTSTTNSGFTNENPVNSVWLRFIMKSLSVGVKSVVRSVNVESKLLISRFPCYKEKKKIM